MITIFSPVVKVLKGIFLIRISNMLGEEKIKIKEVDFLVPNLISLSIHLT